jgi:hypothetical protein
LETVPPLPPAAQNKLIEYADPQLAMGVTEHCDATCASPAGVKQGQLEARHSQLPAAQTFP